MEGFGGDDVFEGNFGGQVPLRGTSLLAGSPRPSPSNALSTLSQGVLATHSQLPLSETAALVGLAMWKYEGAKTPLAAQDAAFDPNTLGTSKVFSSTCARVSGLETGQTRQPRL